jgi:hypothetical protein
VHFVQDAMHDLMPERYFTFRHRVLEATYFTTLSQLDHPCGVEDLAKSVLHMLDNVYLIVTTTNC